MSFYVCAHQDDWQLFMGTNVFNDINAFNERDEKCNGKKVIIIYTTAGNLNDTDDAKSCDCKDPYDQYKARIPYWKVREEGAKNSIHLAAARIGGWGPGSPYPRNTTAMANGHKITRYEYKNTVSYYLRIKASQYNRWGYSQGSIAETVDSSATYVGWSDLVNTLYYIYKTETDSSLTTDNAQFYFPDMDEDSNPGDHPEHYLAGRAGWEAAKMLSEYNVKCYPTSLFVDYNTKNLPPNLQGPDIQNEAALTAVYCMALLDYNAWPEWGNQYQEWTNRNYYRTISTCIDPSRMNIWFDDTLDRLTAKIFPNPAGSQVTVKLNKPVKKPLVIKVMDMNSNKMFEFNGVLPTDSYTIDTRNYPNGSYMVVVAADVQLLLLFEVRH